MEVKATNLNLTNKTLIPAKNDATANSNNAVLGGEKNQDAYSVSLSKEGAERAKVNSAANLNRDSEAYKDYVSKMDSIINKLATGQAVSNKDKQWFDTEVENYATGRYDAYCDFELENADFLNKYIEDREAKEREYNRLTEQLEADKALHDGSLFSHLKKEHDLQDEEDLVKTLTESLKDEEEDFKTEKESNAPETDEAYFKEGFIDRYMEKELMKAEDSIGRDLKQDIKNHS